LISCATPADPGELLALDELCLVLLERRCHRVELPRESAELVGCVHVDARVEVSGRDASRPVAQPLDRARDRPKDARADRRGQDGRTHQEEERPPERLVLKGSDTRLDAIDPRLEPADETIRALLDERHLNLRLRVLGLDVGLAVPEDGGDDPLPEDVVEVGRRARDVVDPRALLRGGDALPQRLRQLGDPLLGRVVELQVTVVPQDDRVSLMRVLIAHGARELER